MDGIEHHRLDLFRRGSPSVQRQKRIDAELYTVAGRIGLAGLPVVQDNPAGAPDHQIGHREDLEAIEQKMGPAFHGQKGVAGQRAQFLPDGGGQKRPNSPTNPFDGGLPFFGGEFQSVFMLEKTHEVDRIRLVGAGARLPEFLTHLFDLAGCYSGGQVGSGIFPRPVQEVLERLMNMVSGPLLAGEKAFQAVQVARHRRGGFLPAAPRPVIGKVIAFQAGLEHLVPRVRPGKIVGQRAHGGGCRRRSMSRRQRRARPPPAVSR